MDCPSCKNSKLSPVQLDEGLVAAGCERCEGALLPLINYRFWRETPNGTKEHNHEEVCETSGAKLCPKCKKLMTKFQIGANTGNRLELCSQCDEAWLDKGEWALLKQLELHNKLPEIFTSAWQTNIRKERQLKSWRLHFENLIGKEEFEKVEEFKLWLDQHEKVSEIKHYLNTRLDL